MTADNELYDPSGGDLQPYQPGTDLAPITPADDWGNTDVDYLSERPSPATRDPQVAEAFKEVGIVIAADLQRLNHPAKSISAAQQWYAANMGKEPRPERVNHRYNLHDMQNDVLANNFANAMARAGASQEFVSNVLWLLAEAAKRLTGNAVAQGRAPSTGTSADAIMDTLDDRTYDYVVKHNETVKGQTETVLRNKYGDAYPQVVATANAYLANLPESHRAHFDQFEPGTWTLALNSVSTIEGLYLSAVGGHNLPSGSALQTEIMQIENFMRVNRTAYNKDLRIQGRLRTLYQLRDG